MSIQYRFVPIYDNLNEDSEKVTGFYPKVVSRGTINKERMFEEISHGSSSPVSYTHLTLPTIA